MFPINLLWFVVTIGVYLCAIFLQKISKNHILVSPAVISIIIIVCILYCFSISYADYMQGGGIISFFLGSATVALAIPLYKNKSILIKQSLAILISVLISSLLTIFTAYYLSKLLGGDKSVQLSIILKSISTPIAIAVANKIGAVASLAVMFVFSTGIFGAVFALPILSILKIKDERALGMALGTICHGLGVARAFQLSETAGVFSVLGMSIMGILSGCIIPLIAVYL